MNGIVSKPDGTLDFSWPDRYFNEAEKRGIGVLVVLDYDHPDLHQPGAPRPYIPVEAHDRWIAYVRSVASRYSDRAWGFEVWNEPNLSKFWRGSRDEFVSLARVTVQTIREAAPGVPIAVAGLSLLPLDWLDALHAQGVVDAADAISFHPYWIDAEGALDMVDMAVEWLDQNGLDRELWLTEYGWPTGGEYPTATDLDGQAERLVRFAVGIATRGVRASWWYASHDYHDPDDVDPDASSEAFFGTAWPTAGDKPSARAFAVLARLLPGSVVVSAGASPLASGGAVRTSAFLRPDGAFVVVATNTGEVPAKRTVPSGTVVEWPDSAPVARWSEVEIQPGRSVVLSIPAGVR